MIALVAAGGIFFFLHRSTGPLPSYATRPAGFTLYYPMPMIHGYSLMKGSAKLNGGSAFYTLHSGSDVITVSEQAAPVNPPDLTKLAA